MLNKIVDPTRNKAFPPSDFFSLQKGQKKALKEKVKAYFTLNPMDKIVIKDIGEITLASHIDGDMLLSFNGKAKTLDDKGIITLTHTQWEEGLSEIEGGKLRDKLDSIGLFIDKVVLVNSVGENEITLVNRSKLIEAVESTINHHRNNLIKKYAVMKFHFTITPEVLNSYDFKLDEVNFPDIAMDGSASENGMPFDMIDFFHDETVYTLNYLGIKQEYVYRGFFVELSDIIFEITESLLREDINRYFTGNNITLDTISKDIAETIDCIK